MKDDLISRQAALTAIQNAYCDTEGGEDKCAVWKNVGLTEALHIMQDLPSAQPEIIRCKDCKYQEKYFHEDRRRKDGGYCIYGCELAEGYSHVCLDDDFCSRAERRTDE